MRSNLKRIHHGQMSESFYTAMFLSLSGGLQDAYTYLFRGKVFANAQTGNIVLLSDNLFAGQWDKVLHYLIPLLAFALGVFTAEMLREQFKSLRSLHWRQLVVLCEILLLFAVGFFPQEWNLLANAIVSFSCAMQVQTFRKVNGYGFASTMCIGNLRSGMEALCGWMRTGSAQAKDKAFHYFGIIFLFGLGSGLGSVGVQWFGRYAIWGSCLLLVVSFILMFIKEDLEDDPAIESELNELRQDLHTVDHLLKEELQEEHQELRDTLHPEKHDR